MSDMPEKEKAHVIRLRRVIAYALSCVGYSNRDIGLTLNCSHTTVANYLSGISEDTEDKATTILIKTAVSTLY